jgi:hypothetical protein
MGRKSHNKTYEQVLEEKRTRAMEYYRKNRERVNAKRRIQYEKLKKTSEKNN